MFAVQRWPGIDPDLLLLGKAFAASGQPIETLLGTDTIMRGTELHLGSTYGFIPAAELPQVGDVRAAGPWRLSGLWLTNTVFGRHQHFGRRCIMNACAGVF